jgi:putative PIN family toxin of toxin-antitoxin system
VQGAAAITMRLPAVVIDTNVLVSGLITIDERSPVCRIVNAMLIGSFTFFLSQTLLKEYRDVLLRPKVQSLHSLTSTEIDRLLSDLVQNAVWREVKITIPAPDPGDNHLWDLLNAHPGSILVTGDRLLVDNPPEFASVLTPRTFVNLLDQSVTQ